RRAASRGTKRELYNRQLLSVKVALRRERGALEGFLLSRGKRRLGEPDQDAVLARVIRDRAVAQLELLPAPSHRGRAPVFRLCAGGQRAEAAAQQERHDWNGPDPAAPNRLPRHQPTSSLSRTPPRVRMTSA